MKLFFPYLMLVLFSFSAVSIAEDENYLSFQLPGNPPMQVISEIPPAPRPVTGAFDIRDGFKLVDNLDEFREVIKKDNQKIRMKPGIYRPVKLDPPMKNQEHIFAVNGSNNHFDLRGVVFETTVSLQSRLTGRAHVADCWHINGSGNTFEGGYFRNLVDRPYPDYRVAENEFEICGDSNTFLNCTFVVKGSVPYGYSDFYGKGGPNFGRLNKHSFMSISNADNTKIVGCRVYMKSFGHCIHFHTVDGVLIKDCYLTGTLRSTDDIYKEKVGRAVEYDFNIMYRGKRPIPRSQVIPLTEDGIRAYEEVKNITVADTVVKRMRGCFQLLCVGDITLDNVTVLECGDFSYDLSSGDKGRVIMKNCRGDIAYNPLFNLTRGDVPENAFYEITIIDPGKDVTPTQRTGFGTICGDNCTFIFRDGTTRPIPRKFNIIDCGGKKPLKNSTVTNYTSAKIILNKSVTGCIIRSLGPVQDNGSGNRVISLGKAAKAELPASKPLYRDPVYDGAADPVVIWNPHVKAWWMFYTNRRASMDHLRGVSWVHATDIGIAQLERSDNTWNYAGIAQIDDGTDLQRATYYLLGTGSHHRQRRPAPHVPYPRSR